MNVINPDFRYHYVVHYIDLVYFTFRQWYRFGAKHHVLEI